MRRRKTNYIGIALIVFILVPAISFAGILTAESSMSYDKKILPWEQEILDSGSFDIQSFLLDRDMRIQDKGIEGWHEYFVDKWTWYCINQPSGGYNLKIPKSLIKEIIKKWHHKEEDIEEEYRKIVKNRQYKDLSYDEFIIIYDRAMRDKGEMVDLPVPIWKKKLAKIFGEWILYTKPFSTEDNPSDPAWLRKFNSVGRAIEEAGAKLNGGVAPLPVAPGLSGGK